MEVQPKEIRRYIRPDRTIPFAEWLNSLRDSRAILKIDKRLRRRSIGQTMKNVKMPNSDSYHDALIESLKDSERAAGNIEVALELEEKDPQPDLLLLTLKDVMEAHEQMNNLSKEAKLCYEKFNKILLETGGSEIYSLVELLDALGFRIAIAPK